MKKSDAVTMVLKEIIDGRSATLADLRKAEKIVDAFEENVMTIEWEKE